MREKLYEWALKHLPTWIMYKRRWIDTQHQMYFPRWGHTEGQKLRAKEYAEQLCKKLKFD